MADYRIIDRQGLIYHLAEAADRYREDAERKAADYFNPDEVAKTLLCAVVMEQAVDLVVRYTDHTETHQGTSSHLTLVDPTDS